MVTRIMLSHDSAIAQIPNFNVRDAAHVYAYNLVPRPHHARETNTRTAYVGALHLGNRPMIEMKRFLLSLSQHTAWRKCTKALQLHRNRFRGDQVQSTAK